MIHSMTGYAAITNELPYGSFSLELRSVNNRYLDIQFRVPDELRMLEPAMRELLTTQLNRGKIDCRLSFSLLASTEYPQQLNTELLEKLGALNHTIKSALPEARGLSVIDVLHWPGILKNSTPPTQDLRETAMALLCTALDEFKATRAREGEKLKTILLERVNQIRQLLATASPLIPALLVAFQQRLKFRLQEAMVNHEDDRIRQEISLFSGKIDIDEELSRLQAHLDEVERILSQGGAVGKRLDFLMQELNREANTIGSKSVDIEVSKISMEIKVLVEQMREQVQNIE